MGKFRELSERPNSLFASFMSVNLAHYLDMTVLLFPAELSTSNQSKSLFVQTINPMTGKKEWKNVPEDYDYQQELARAAFADMLHDSERVKGLLPHPCSQLIFP